MAKKFLIEVVNFEKCIKNKMDIADDTIGYAIETLFETGERIYLWWNGCPIPLSVKYDVSEIWNDIILMIKKVQQGSQKEFTIHWPSATFFATWEFKVDNHLLQIKPYWSTLNLEKKVLLKLRADEMPLIIEKQAFLEEWFKILIPMKRVLFVSGYDVKKLKNFKKSFSVLNNISANFIFYPPD